MACVLEPARWHGAGSRAHARPCAPLCLSRLCVDVCAVSRWPLQYEDEEEEEFFDGTDEAAALYDLPLGERARCAQAS